ncbi:MAG: sulfurtransferase [Acidimicrobiales bacterium]|jgi:thiosulfate/3-mercaptopyruvate sulfurtransferase
MIAPVVDPAWWDRHKGDPNVALADVRWYLDGRSGRAAYEDGHLPGAVFVDLPRWLSGEGGPSVGRHPLPDPGTFAEGMARSGIGDDTIVIAYDDAGGVIAARLVWMLRATGHEAALLDGGVTAYRGPLEKGSGSADLRQAAFTARPWPAGKLAGAADAADRGNVVIDARDRDRYRGAQDPIDPRPGHIPGASNLPCRENLAADGTFVPADELRRRFEEAGVVEGSSVISYCGSGVTACHNLLALELAGFAPGRLYPGSWSQYSQMADVDVATGSSPG